MTAMITPSAAELPPAERFRRIGELFSLGAERYWRAERIAGRPFAAKQSGRIIQGSLLDLVTDPVEAQIVRLIINRVEASPRDLQGALGISRATITRKIAKLRTAGLLTVVGRTRLARYALRGPDGRN